MWTRGRVVQVCALVVVAAVANLQPGDAAALLATPGRAGGCSVDINDDSSFPDPQPLFLIPGGSGGAKAFWQPDATSGLLTLEAGEQLLLACPGRGNLLTALDVQEATATCVSGSTFSVGDQQFALQDLSCSHLPTSTQQDSGQTCGAASGSFPLLQIGFELSAGFVKTIDVCFDDERLATLYSQSTIVAGIGGSQKGFPRRGWKQGDFFGDIDVNKAYTQKQQKATISEILGSSELGDQYVSSGKYYMARGHLSADADWVFGSLQIATFWFLNVAPQWQTFNGGNWEMVESDVRDYASKKGVDLTVYTGTYGVTTLPNVDGVETELYLVPGTKQIPVPKLYWRVVLDTANDAGVVLIGVNNPYVADPGEDYYLCPDVCSKLNWLTWHSDDQTKGYSYCCEVSEFQKVVTVLPEISVSSLPTL
nr:double stranded RNA degrading enzyme 3 [Locusta migratoria]